MPTFADIEYNTLDTRSQRILSFFSDLEAKLASIGAPSAAHLDLEWNGTKVVRSLDGIQISSLSNPEQLQYYNQGLGLMKLAMNKQLYP